MRIEEIDKNFVMGSLEGRELLFRDCWASPFELNGLAFFSAEKEFCRLPIAKLASQNDGIRGLAWHTAGAQVRFRSDSGVVGLRCELRNKGGMTHMPLTGSSGFDLYIGEGSSKRFVKVCRPEWAQLEYSGLLYLGAGGVEQEFTINFPLYNGVKRVEIGLSPGANVSPPTAFAIEKPVLFYGSSITQGGCAGRPGTCYTQVLSRHLDFECLNYGFSGSARGELETAEIIAGLDLSCFVMDYDHNAPTADHLWKTHEPFFKFIRQRQPMLPVVLVSRPDWPWNVSPEGCIDRRKAVLTTYNNAVAAGDKNVYFVDGELMFAGIDSDSCTVDGCHPNDLGFYRMAQAVEPALRMALGLKA